MILYIDHDIIYRSSTRESAIKNMPPNVGCVSEKIRKKLAFGETTTAHCSVPITNMLETMTNVLP